MKFLGKKLKVFNEALSDAFPTKELLQKMVTYHLEMKLDDISSNQNLSTTIDELIEDFASSDKVLDLAEKAFNANSTNHQLKYFYSAYKFYELFDKLDCKVIKNAFEKLDSQADPTYSNLLSEEAPDRRKALIENLLFTNFPRNEKKYLQFISHICREVKTSKQSEDNTLLKDLEELAKIVDEKYDIYPSNSQPKVPEDNDPYLVIIVDSRLQVRAFLDHLDDQHAKPSPVDPSRKFLEENHSINDVKAQVFDLIDEALSKLDIIDPDRNWNLIVEVLLPFKYLAQRIEAWEKPNIYGDEITGCEELGKNYPIFVRSCERLDRSQIKNYLKNEWDKIISSRKFKAQPLKVTEEELEFKQNRELMDSLQKGWPIIILMRCDSLDSRIKESIGELEKEICDILNKEISDSDAVNVCDSSKVIISSKVVKRIHRHIHDMRKKAYEEGGDNHLGYRLSVLCDPRPSSRFSYPNSKLSDKGIKGS